MYVFANYTGKENEDPSEYKEAFDKAAFASWYIPAHCIQRLDFNRPKKMAP